MGVHWDSTDSRMLQAIIAHLGEARTMPLPRSVSVTVGLSVSLSVCQSVCPSVCLRLSLYVGLSASLSMTLANSRTHTLTGRGCGSS